MAANRDEDEEDDVVDISALATAKLESMSDFLRALQLVHLTATFAREDIDLRTAFYVTDTHLIKLGLTLSERVKLLRCLQILKDVPVNPRFLPPPPAAAPAAARPSRPVPIAAVVVSQPPTTPPIVPPITPAAASRPPPLPKFKPKTPPPPLVASSAPPTSPTNNRFMLESKSLAFIAYDAGSNLCLKHARLLEKAFEKELKIDRVSLFAVPRDGADEAAGADAAAAELFRFLNICSNAQDELLWFVFLASSLSVNAAVQPMINVVFDTYQGRSALFVLDAVQSHFAGGGDDDHHPGRLVFPEHQQQLGFSLLSCSYPASPNPLYLSLTLLDTLLGHVTPSSYAFSVDRLVDDALANLEFLERCSDTAIQVHYLPGQEDDAVLREVVLPATPAAAAATPLQERVGGCRGIFQDRPVLVLQAKREDMVLVRFLEEYSDPQYAQLADIMLDYCEEEEEEDGMESRADESVHTFDDSMLLMEEEVEMMLADDDNDLL